MNSLGLDPKLTLAVYIGGAVAFLIAITTMFVYSSRMKARKAVENAKGRKEVSVEEGIAIATEGKNHERNR